MVESRKFLDDAVRDYTAVLMVQGNSEGIVFLEEIYDELCNYGSDNLPEPKRPSFSVEKPSKLGETFKVRTQYFEAETNVAFKVKITSQTPVFITLMTNSANSRTLELLLSEGEELVSAGYMPNFVIVCNNCDGNVATSYYDNLRMCFSVAVAEVLNYKTSFTGHFENLGQVLLRDIMRVMDQKLRAKPFYVISIDDDVEPVNQRSFLKAVQLANLGLPLLSGLAIPVFDGTPFSRYKDSFRSLEVAKQVDWPKPTFYGAFHIRPYEIATDVFSPLVPYDQQLAFYSLINFGGNPHALFDLAFWHKEHDTLWSWVEKKKVGDAQKIEYCRQLGRLSDLKANDSAQESWNEQAIRSFAKMQGGETKVVVGTRLVNTYLRQVLNST